MSTGIKHFLSAFGVGLMTWFATLPADADVAFVPKPSAIWTGPGLTFRTDIELFSWDNVVGALSIVVSYSPGVICIREIKSAPDSPFAGGVFVDDSSFTSGSTRIAALQTSDVEDGIKHFTLATIIWDVVGDAGESSDIAVKEEKVIDVSWKNTEVWSYPCLVMSGDDVDGDGLPNWVETNTGVYVDCADTGTDPNVLDTDGDGLPDGWEVRHFLNPVSSTGDDGQEGDPDRDGKTNDEELVAGTDPADPTSVFSIDQMWFDPGTGDLILAWKGVAGKRYQVQHSGEPHDWLPASGIIEPQEDGIEWWQAEGSAAFIRGFYRVTVIPR